MAHHNCAFTIISLNWKRFPDAKSLILTIIQSSLIKCNFNEQMSFYSFAIMEHFHTMVIAIFKANFREERVVENYYNNNQKCSTITCE